MNCNCILFTILLVFGDYNILYFLFTNWFHGRSTKKRWYVTYVRNAIFPLSNISSFNVRMGRILTKAVDKVSKVLDGL